MPKQSEDSCLIAHAQSLSQQDIFPPIQQSSVMKGDILFASSPFAYILKSSMRGLHCDTCLRKKQGARRCSGCASVYYCNRDCQKNSWEIHKKECSNLKKIKPNFPPDTVRLMARIIFKFKDGLDNCEEDDDTREQKCRTFKDLMSHCTDILKDAEKQEHFSALLVVLDNYLGKEHLPNSSDLFSIYGKVLVNSFTITDKDMNPVGIGIYLAPSILDHSCNANAFVSFIGTQIFVRSLTDMPTLDLKKVHISYIDVLNNTADRNKELETGYFFSCHCRRCHDTEKERTSSSINCGNPGCPHPVYINEEETLQSPISPCASCGFDEFTPNTRETYFEVLKLTQQKLAPTQKKKNHMDDYRDLLEIQGSLFHKLNIWRVKVLDCAFDGAINNSSFDISIMYGCENLDGIRYYYGSNHPTYGMYLLKLGKIELYLFKLQEALKHLEEAELIFRVSHGKEHPLYVDDLLPLLNQANQEIKMMQCNGFIPKPVPKNEQII